MDNPKIFAIYEKYLNSGDLSGTDDESDIDLSFGDEELKNFAATAKTPSKSRRRSSVSPLNNTTLAVRQKMAQMENQTNAILTKAQQNSASLEIPADILASLAHMGDVNVIEFLTELNEDFYAKHDQVPKVLAQQLKQKLTFQLTAIRQMIDAEEERFNRQIALIDQQSFKDKFQMNVTFNANSDLQSKAKKITEALERNNEIIEKLKICKELGLK